MDHAIGGSPSLMPQKAVGVVRVVGERAAEAGAGSGRIEQQKANGRLVRWYRAAVIALLGTHVVLLVWGASTDSPTIDEVAYLPAGISHWTLGRFDLYRVNPPLVRMVAALPAIAAGARTDWRHYRSEPAVRVDSLVGRDFLNANRGRWRLLFLWARLACCSFSLLGAVVCYCWARELYGQIAGLVALGLWCFSPNVVAHGHLITPDLGAAATGLLASFSFWHWTKRPDWEGVVWAGLCLGLAQLAKTTWLVLFPLWPMLWLGYRLTGKNCTALRPWKLEAGQLAVALLLGLVVLNAGYGFEGSFKRLGQYRFVSNTLGGVPLLPEDAGQYRTHFRATGNRFQSHWLGLIPVPLPSNYVQGIDVQKRFFEHRLWCYLGGQWKIGGWWYFYLYAALVKVPLGTWALVAAALVCRAAGGQPRAWRDEIFLLVPAIALLVLVSSHTGITRNFRYVLPVLPVLFVWGSGVVPSMRGWLSRCLIAVLLSWSVAGSLWVMPHSLSYFNELAGGPLHGHNHLLFSNTDWGQDMLRLERWVLEHPEARPLGISVVHRNVRPRFVGIEMSRSPQLTPVYHLGAPRSAGNLAPGWYVVSVNNLHSRTGRFDALRRRKPVARIGYSMWVYHIREGEVSGSARGGDPHPED